MNKNLILETHPLPPAGWWILIAGGVAEPRVYRYHEDRWFLRDESAYPEPMEYMLIEFEDGSLKLVDNSF